MADVVDALTRLGALHSAAAQEILSLRLANTALIGELDALKAVRTASPATARKACSSKMPRAPRARKSFGTATNVDREVLQYTARELEAFGKRCFDAGKASTPPAAGASTSPVSAEEDAWADYRAGRGPHPTRR